ALQPEIRIHRALLSGMRDGTPPPRYMLATARGAPPRAAASGYDVLLDVEAIDLLPRRCMTGLRRGLARRRALRHWATTSCSTSRPSTFCRAPASQACDEAWRAAARCGVGLRRLVRRRGHRPSAAPLHHRLATRPGAPPRAAALGYDGLFDVEAIDLLPRPCITGLRRGLARRRALRHWATTSYSTSRP